MVAGPTLRARTRRPAVRAIRRIGLAAGAGAVLLAALTGCSFKDAFAFGWPHGGITPQAHQMYNLWIGSTIAALVVGVFVWGLIFWCVVAYRKRGEDLPAQTKLNLPIELLYTIVPFLIVAVLFYYTAITETFVDKEHANPDVRVDVVAFKWNWDFRYPQAKDANGQPVETIGSSDYIPVLVVPVGKTIRFTETSKDVIHSFWVPELLFKRDVFPGNTVNSFEVTVEKTGAYVGRCAELCGTYHSQMNFEMRAVTPEQYQKFITAKQKGLSTPDALGAAGFQGKERYAVTTHPFNTDRTDHTAS